jgi:tRNA(Ile)-lysidine synthase
VKSDLRGIEFKHVEAILDALQKVPVQFELELPEGIIAFTEYERVVFAKKQLFEVTPVTPVKLAVPGITRVAALGIGIEARYRDARDLVFEGDGDVAHLDADKIPGELEVRTRKPGDFFMPFGMMGEKKLQDFFVDAKVPKRARDKVPLVTLNGAIIWVAGFRIDERFRVTAQTKRVLVLHLR